MYEVGKLRDDGKVNVWKRAQISPLYWDWIIDSVWYSLKEASDYTESKNRKKSKK